jgi:hypothetical protein
MSILMLLIVLVVVGVILYLLNTLVPMDGRVKTCINVIIGLLLFLWVIQSMGFVHLGLHLT